MCIPPDAPFFKATCWPSFIAGAETTTLINARGFLASLKRPYRLCLGIICQVQLTVYTAFWRAKPKKQGRIGLLIAQTIASSHDAERLRKQAGPGDDVKDETKS
jgi:hypothetical protein